MPTQILPASKCMILKDFHHTGFSGRGVYGRTGEDAKPLRMDSRASQRVKLNRLFALGLVCEITLLRCYRLARIVLRVRVPPLRKPRLAKTRQSRMLENKSYLFA